jgi:hypothetical protein
MTMRRPRPAEKITLSSGFSGLLGIAGGVLDFGSGYNRH